MPSPGPSGLAAGRAVEAPDAAGLLLESLSALSGHEGEIVERLFELFFERHPEVRELFGEHSINEREEMVRETLVSVLAHAEDQPWLDGNLIAMGRSHAEYGVEGRSYPDFVVAMLDTLDEVAAPGWSAEARAAWERALGRITEVMRRAGDEHGGA